ncbi:MAG: hypothetical protein J7M12_00075 [Candidatus Hydrogenedentes bacterium]|nr:hypothetical protein [Candidatus Hydrogenedentota bacterium]
MIKEKTGLVGQTDEVERVGSYGEKQVARMLSRYRIQYEYEYPMAVRDRGKVRVWYPDFWLPDYGIAIEYVGGISSADYIAGVAHKRAVYEAAGIPCIFVEHDMLRGNWPDQIAKQIRCVLKERFMKFERFISEL